MAQRDHRVNAWRIASWQTYGTMGSLPRSSTVCMQGTDECNDENVALLPHLWSATSFAWRCQQSTPKRCNSGGARTANQAPTVSKNRGHDCGIRTGIQG